MCPQHDTLWDELTAAEHLFLFAGLRGLSSAGGGLAKEAASRLADVGLTAEASTPASVRGCTRLIQITYSLLTMRLD